MPMNNEQLYYDTLRRIAKYYATTTQMDREAEVAGLSRDEFMEMAYENIQFEAASAIRGKRRPK